MMPRERKRPGKLSSAAKGMVFLLLGAGCTSLVLATSACNSLRQSQNPSTLHIQRQFFQSVRPPSGETDRLLKNASILRMLGRHHLALKELEEAYQRDPGNLKVVDALASCYEELGDYQAAQNLYQAALQREPNHPALLNNLCFSYYQTGKWEKAEQCFRDALKRDPGNAKLRNNLGLLLVRQGRQSEAIALWHQHEGEVAARQRLAQALASLGLPAPAEPARRPEPQVASVAPTPPPAPTAAPSGDSRSPLPAPPPAAAPPAPAPASPALVDAVPPAAPPPAPAPAKAPEAASLAAKPVEPAAMSPAPPQVQATAVPPVSLHHASPKEKAAPVTPAAPPAPQAAVKASVKPTPPVKKAASEQPLPPVQHETAPATPSAPTPAAASSPAPAAPETEIHLTLQERTDNRLVVLNGNGLKGIALKHRQWLGMEGFRVTAHGNFRDFGRQHTLIQYCAAAHRVARHLGQQLYPQAELQETADLGGKAEVRIILGKDQLSREKQVSQRLAALQAKAREALAAFARPHQTAKPAEVAAAPAPPASPAEPAKTAAEPPAAVPVVQSYPPVLLTAEELIHTRIALRNGNGHQDMARLLRTHLHSHGFNVVEIKNHIDFGMEQTVISYRPGTERVAQSLARQFFPSARLEARDTLPAFMDVKVTLGKDLVSRTEFLAHLAQ